MPEPRKVLLTGAAGRIGTAFRERFHDTYSFRLVDLREVANPGEHEVVLGDLADLEFARRVCAGIDTVIHLAADPNARATFYGSLLQQNVIATYNVFHAAREAGCRRVIFASSIHAVNAHPLDVQIHPDQPVRPGDVYGATKVWGEALGSYFADREGLSCIALRIGAVGHPERLLESDDPRLLAVFISYRDLTHLIERCVEAPETIRFRIYQGVSNNTYKRMSIENARHEIGYDPQDNAFEITSKAQLRRIPPNSPDI